MHLFFTCPFAVKLWSWLATSLNTTLHLTSLGDIWCICDKSWSPYFEVVIVTALVYLINIIWFVRNEAIFNDKRINWKLAISRVIASTSLIGSHNRKASNNSIRDFTILKNIKATINNPKSPSTLEVV